jgi:hypothetical protein
MAQSEGHRYKIEAGILHFYSVFSEFIGPSKELVLFSKSSFEYLLHLYSKPKLV